MYMRCFCTLCFNNNWFSIAKRRDTWNFSILILNKQAIEKIKNDLIAHTRDMIDDVNTERINKAQDNDRNA